MVVLNCYRHFLQRYVEHDMATSQLFTDGPEDLSYYRMLSGNFSYSQSNFYCSFRRSSHYILFRKQ